MTGPMDHSVLLSTAGHNRPGHHHPARAGPVSPRRVIPNQILDAGYQEIKSSYLSEPPLASLILIVAV